MADKKITDLTLIDEATDDVSLPGDDGVQTYRITIAQIKEFVLKSAAPLGSISAFAGTTPPSTNWFICNGQDISRTTYATLFSLIGTTHGAGDGVTTFGLPDLRGEFIRGLDNGRGVDSSRTLGSDQNDTTRRPRNTSFTTNTTGDHTHVREEFASVASGGSGRLVPSGAGSNRSTQSAGDHSHSITGGGDAETRPRNIAMNYIIKVIA